LSVTSKNEAGSTKQPNLTCTTANYSEEQIFGTGRGTDTKPFVEFTSLKNL